MLLPALSRARTVAVRTKCASNVRQIGVGTFTYAHDHNGELPKRSLQVLPHNMEAHNPAVEQSMNESFIQHYIASRDMMFCPSTLLEFRNSSHPSYVKHYITYQFHYLPAVVWKVPKPDLSKIDSVDGRYALWSCLSTQGSATGL